MKNLYDVVSEADPASFLRAEKSVSLICLVILFLPPQCEGSQASLRTHPRERGGGTGVLVHAGGNYGCNPLLHASSRKLHLQTSRNKNPRGSINRAKPANGEVTPLVVDGVIYVSERPNIITAIDGKTGRPLWNYRRPMPNDVPGCCGPVNRGLAILGDALYVNTYDCHLVCIDVNTGKERWDMVVADYPKGHSMTAAPLAVKDKIIVGISGGEYWHSRFFGCVRCENRRACLAFLDDARYRRARSRNVGRRRCLENRRRRDVGHWHL